MSDYMSPPARHGVQSNFYPPPGTYPPIFAGPNIGAPYPGQPGIYTDPRFAYGPRFNGIDSDGLTVNPYLNSLFSDVNTTQHQVEFGSGTGYPPYGPPPMGYNLPPGVTFPNGMPPGAIIPPGSYPQIDSRDHQGGPGPNGPPPGGAPPPRGGPPGSQPGQRLDTHA